MEGRALQGGYEANPGAGVNAAVTGCPTEATLGAFGNTNFGNCMGGGD